MFPIVLVKIEAPSIPIFKAREKEETGNLVCFPTNFILSDLIIIDSLKLSLLASLGIVLKFSGDLISVLFEAFIAN